MSTDRFTRRLIRTPREEDFDSPVQDPRVAARLGLWLGAALLVCLATGLLSHDQQRPDPWLQFGPAPAWGYRVSQGVHVATGIACLPLLLAKLYAVYPRLFSRPAVRGPLHALERAGVALLVAATALELVTGVMNIAQWYPWGFGFVPVHHAAAWLAGGALAVHVAVKLPVVRSALGEGAEPLDAGRRGFVTGALAAAGVLTLLTVGQTVRPLQGLALLAPRRPGTGPQGLPVNRTAAAAGVAPPGAGWALELAGPHGLRRLSRADLAGLPQREVTLPIACVEGWSAGARWRGVPVADLVRLAGGGPGSVVAFESLERRGSYRASTLPAAFAADPRTLLALELNGEVLDLEHGFPARLIAPDRPGVLQTKWVARMTVSA